MNWLILVSALQITGSQAHDFGLPNATAQGTVALTQCRFRSGARIALFRPGRRRDFEMIFVEGDHVDVSEINTLPAGRLDIETNGGVASLRAVQTLFDELRQAAFTHVKAAEVRRQLSNANAPYCRNPYKNGAR